MAKKISSIATAPTSNSTGGYNWVPDVFGDDYRFTKDTKQSDESIKKNRDNNREYKRKHG